MYAIQRPSGDHAGRLVLPRAAMCALPFSGCTTTAAILPLWVKTSVLPSGDQFGSLSGPDVTRRSPRPSLPTIEILPFLVQASLRRLRAGAAWAAWRLARTRRGRWALSAREA